MTWMDMIGLPGILRDLFARMRNVVYQTPACSCCRHPEQSSSDRTEEDVKKRKEIEEKRKKKNLD